MDGSLSPLKTNNNKSCDAVTHPDYLMAWSLEVSKRVWFPCEVHSQLRGCAHSEKSSLLHWRKQTSFRLVFVTNGGSYFCISLIFYAVICRKVICRNGKHFQLFFELHFEAFEEVS